MKVRAGAAPRRPHLCPGSNWERIERDQRPLEQLLPCDCPAATGKELKGNTSKNSLQRLHLDSADAATGKELKDTYLVVRHYEGGRAATGKELKVSTSKGMPCLLRNSAATGKELKGSPLGCWAVSPMSQCSNWERIEREVCGIRYPEAACGAATGKELKATMTA